MCGPCPWYRRRPVVAAPWASPRRQAGRRRSRTPGRRRSSEGLSSRLSLAFARRTNGGPQTRHCGAKTSTPTVFAVVSGTIQACERGCMTYCLGILLPQGLVLASDSRSNAGVDQVVRVSKLNLMPRAEDRVIAIQSSGNLATTQAVVTRLHEAFGSGDSTHDLARARTMFEVAGVVGAELRDNIIADAKFVDPYRDPTGNFLVSGQIAGEPPRLLQIYAAGNFVEASSRSPFLQIGETKYGKPILDRSLTPDCPLAEAAKLALISFDATLRSNPSVGLPIV